ncbi:MAG: hypothetical protein KIT22_06205, partial [Verrucomicrobiae bacterium]|nr:hypothetical protein [Verrucomicrobiae bacterium]
RASPRKALFVSADEDRVAPSAVIRELLAAADPESQWVELKETSHELAPFQLETLRAPVTEWLLR